MFKITIPLFQFQNGSINSDIPEGAAGAEAVFQFQNGSINRHFC